MTEYTPSVDELRKLYLLKVPYDQRERRNAEFNRFITAAEQRGAVKALRDAANEIPDVWIGHPSPAQWLHDRADQIAGETNE